MKSLKERRGLAIPLYSLAIILFILEVFVCPRCARAAEGRAVSEVEGLEDFELRALRRARRTSDLATVKRVASLNSERASCSARLKAGLLPAFCFKVLHDEAALGLMSTIAANRERTWLTRVCVERARASERWPDLQTFLNSDFLPTQCREIVERRLSDLRYRDEEEKPASLFSRRLQSTEVPAGVDRILK
jgi:hypothetical protein